MSEDMDAKSIRGSGESKNEQDVDKTAYAFDVAKEALEGAESSLACAIRVIQSVAEAVKAATAAAKAAKQGGNVSQQDDGKPRASIRAEL